ncbi:SDR family NAD(P)-dependent oxidoreductase [Luteococcus sp.]|uniref:SDR family NAD(P)-dependent oxidoreductase n=1 Tax=Luteococcus sp. TaxID=1969402 RepID=UPI00373580D5
MGHESDPIGQVKQADWTVAPLLRGLLADDAGLPRLRWVPTTAAGDAWRPSPELLDSHDLEGLRADLAGHRTGRRVPGSIALREGHLVVEPTSGTGRLAGRVAMVTGAAQGFGRGIAGGLATHGAQVVLADVNHAGARRAAEDIAQQHPDVRTLAVAIDVSDPDSTGQAIAEVVRHFGGIDLFVANAGIVRAGSLAQLSPEDFDLVTRVNYHGFFLGARAVAPVMALQHRAAPQHLFDIVEVNSKSGLNGSSRNSAYAGSKFGGIGLVQSFALELASQGIKVNAVCPGNFLDGPLWTDPDKGLLCQYLEAGKVPGARSVDDVRAHYEAQVPLGRGCQPQDVVRAITYCVEQQYETGQAIPVTGGQTMLR